MNPWSICVRFIRDVRNSAAIFIVGSGKGVLALTVGTCGVLLAAPLSDAYAKAAAPTRPLSASCETTFAFTATGSIRIEGTCHYSHLGLTATIADQIAIPQANGTLQIVNTATYTAANGDELFATFVGVGVFESPVLLSFSGVETYTGGTGRFADATGSATLTGGAEFTSASAGVGHYSAQGTISY